MKIITNNIIPLKGFKAMTIYSFMLVRKEYSSRLSVKDYNHESIHCAQHYEIFLATVIILGILIIASEISFWWLLLAIPMPFVLYVLEWLVRLIIDKQTAYRKISFEQEAYGNEHDDTYGKGRMPFAWLKYLKTY